MATVDPTNPIVQPPEDYSAEVARARQLAERYRQTYVDMDNFRIDQELFRTIPADLMLRYGFVPYRREGQSLVIVVSDPTDLPMIDELSVVLGTPVKVTVGAPSAIQSIPNIAEQAEHLFVFQRTPNFSVPARNAPLDPEEQREIKADYASLRAWAKSMPTGLAFPVNRVSALDATPEQREREYESRWQHGGTMFMGAYKDLLFNPEANETAAAFVRDKIREIVHDPGVAETLSPHDVIGCKRLCVDTGYFATFNRANVTLVDVSTSPIEAITRRGVQVAGREYAVDAIVLATGFDAMTGALLAIDIRGRDGATLGDKWDGGPRAYLGLAMAGFPNLFTITGPGSPSVLANMITCIEQHVDWIADCMAHMRARGLARIEPTAEAEEAWVAHVNAVAGGNLRSTCSSWYNGANVPGKSRVFMPYIGGFPVYVRKCEEVTANGYDGFEMTAG